MFFKNHQKRPFLPLEVTIFWAKVALKRIILRLVGCF